MPEERRRIVPDATIGSLVKLPDLLKAMDSGSGAPDTGAER